MAYAPRDVTEERPRGNPAVLAGSAGAVPGCLVLLVFVLFAPLVALVLGVLVCAGVAWAVWHWSSALVLRLVGGERPDLSAPGPARLENLTASLSAAAGVPKPRLVVIDDPAPNALITGRRPREATLVATTGLLDLDRLELEAVVAHQLTLLRTGATHSRDVATVVLGVPGTRVPALARAAERAVTSDERGVLALDAAAVGVTRYPPGLLAALERAASAPPVAAHPALAPLWWVPARRDVLDLRLDHLRELA